MTVMGLRSTDLRAAKELRYLKACSLAGACYHTCCVDQSLNEMSVHFLSFWIVQI